MATVTLRNDIAELERLAGMVSEFWSAHGLPPALEADITLALDEAVSNVIRYGFRDGAEHHIEVSLTREGDQLRLAVEDDGVAFNPLERPDPDVTLPLAERPIGGLGIYLIRRLMDGVEYRRAEGRNRLVMTRRILKTTASGPTG